MRVISSGTHPSTKFGGPYFVSDGGVEAARLRHELAVMQLQVARLTKDMDSLQMMKQSPVVCRASKATVGLCLWLRHLVRGTQVY